MRKLSVLLVVPFALSCKRKEEPQPRPQPDKGSEVKQRTYDAIARADFNRFAVRQNIGVYWIEDANGNQALDADEVAALLFYGAEPPVWAEHGTFAQDFGTAYDKIVAASKAPAPDASTPDGKRLALVQQDLDAGRPTLVRSDFTKLPSEERAFVLRMMGVAKLIDELYETQNGARAVAPSVAPDPESQSLFRRNRGPSCEGPVSSKDPACSALIPGPGAGPGPSTSGGAPKHTVDAYPVELQAADTFCKDLQAHPDAKELMGHFNVVRGPADALKALPYTEAYKDQMTKIADALDAAAADIKDPTETLLVTYLQAAAASFRSNDWVPADEAWAKMNVDNSKWYVRVGPDEVYWDPCATKAGFHLSFARINEGSKQWQQKLVPVQQEMENAVAKIAGPPYKAREVTFHLPDFIDIVVNAGDDRDALGATIGQSLPNWGPVANEGRGRTVAMVNFYTDPDSRAARKAQAESLLDAASGKLYASSTEPGLLSTILHEVMHNLGPAHEYRAFGKKADQAFGGPIASMMEELKAQTGAWFLLELLRGKQIISDELAQQSFVDSIVWAFGHISQGMYTADNNRKAYGNLAAIQIGYLIDKGALTWDGSATAANGTDKGAFTIHAAKLVPVANQLMKEVGGIKARGDKAAADKLIARYVDSEGVVPHKIIAERFLRHPRPSFVYSVAL
jgi:hypothetical protein